MIQPKTNRKTHSQNMKPTQNLPKTYPNLNNTCTKPALKISTLAPNLPPVCPQTSTGINKNLQIQRYKKRTAKGQANFFRC